MALSVASAGQPEVMAPSKKVPNELLVLSPLANHRRRHRWRFWTGKPGLAEATASQSPDPAALLDGRRAAALFYQALDQLPEKYRTVLVLFEIEGAVDQGHPGLPLLPSGPRA